VHAEALAQARELAGKLEGLSVEITQKAGVDGRLFGSVTNHDIADALAAQGVEVQKGAVRLPDGPLKTVGDHQVSVVLHTDVVVDITVSVMGEQ
jgi:large subunit ribosomal protein L9